MSALYQKYRPQRFADMAGQETIKKTLQNEIASGTTVHAYLFAGPRAVGKTTTARLLARALNCEARQAGESEPCNACPSCESILHGKTLDVLEIDAASNNGVENVRETIMTAARVATAQLKVKVFILDEVHMLSTGAFNALLKTLEEPPANVVFIMATTELRKVPATIVSRCQRFDFKKIDPEAMQARLADITKQEGKEIDEEILAEIVRRGGGCARDAEGLLGQILSLDDKKIDKELAALVLPRSDHALVGQLATAMVRGEVVPAIAVIRQLTEEGIDLPTFTNDLLEYLRAMLMVQINSTEGLSLTKKELTDLQAAGEGSTPDRLLKILDSVINAQKDVKWLTLPHLALEMAVVRSGIS